MDHTRRVPEDLMGTILSTGLGFPDEEHAFADYGDPDRKAIGPWEEKPDLVGVAFNLSKQLSAELDRIRLELEEDTHPSRSEIAEVALQMAVEDYRSKGRESDLVKRIEERHVARAVDTSGDRHSVVRSVDRGGSIIETTYGEKGKILDEKLVGDVADLPVEAEYVDAQGRLVSVAKDELGNTFEQVLDNDLNVLETRLLDG